MVSVQFRKNFTVPSFCGRWASKSYTDISFEGAFKKLYCRDYCCFRVLAGKKAPSNKTPALTKSENMGIWVVGTSN